MRAQDWRAAITGMLVLLFVLLAARDISRPFSGLHSWDQAQDAWSARAQLDYGLRYTKGLTTMAIGNPPPVVPPWYLDHPQLPSLLDAGAMAIFGRNEAALRLASLIVVAASLPFLMALLRRLYDDETSFLATFLFTVFPITSYFNYSSSCWIFPSFLLAYWCYLIVIGELRDAPPPGKRHFFGLAFALFILPQLSWVGLFYDAAIGSHYVLRCLVKRRRPDYPLLLTLALVPAASAASAFGLLICARGGWRSLLGVYLWRAQGAAVADGRTFFGWFRNAWRMLQLNFTLPVILIAGAYLAYRTLANVRRAQSPVRSSRVFVHAWILLMPALLEMTFLSESFWVHNHEYKWLSLPLAVATALGILAMRDLLLARGRAAANAATFAILAVICGFAARGIEDYFTFSQWSQTEIDAFKKLKSEMAPDETLLTYSSYISADNPNKLSFLRPEIAWYLDRKVVTASTLDDVRRLAAAGKCPFYWVPQGSAPLTLIEQLMSQYPWEVVQIRQDIGRQPVFDAGDQLIFDLRGGASRASKAPRQSRAGSQLAKAFQEEIPLLTSQGNWQALLSRGIEYANRGASDEGLAFLMASLSINADDVAAHLDAGYLYGLKGDVDHAIEQTQAAVALDPNNVDVRNNLGFFMQQKGRYHDAVAQFQEAQRIAPQNQLAKNNIATALSGLASHNAEVQALLLRKDGQTLLDRGIESANRGAVDEGMDFLLAAISIDARSPVARFEASYLYGLKGDIDHAIEQAQAAVALDPNMADARNNLGSFLERKGRYREAVVQFQEAIKRAPKDQLARNNLAAALAHLAAQK